MTSATPGPGSRSAEIVDSLILVLAAGLVFATLVIVVTPDLAPAVVNDRFDVALVTASLLVSGAVAALQWARGRLGGDGAALLRAASFAVLATVNSLILIVLLLDVEHLVGGRLEEPGQVPIVVTVVGRGVAALLLVVAGLPWVRLRAVAWSGWLVLVVPVTLVLGASLLATIAGDRLPPLVGPEALEQLAVEPTGALEPAVAPLYVLIQAFIGAAFLTAALLAYRSFQVSRRLGEGLIACGLVLAAFSQVHAAIHPGTYAGLITTADLLRLGFYGFLLAGIIVDNRDDLRALRQANIELRRLADAERAAATLGERARLAREIHDGLAQDLWFAKLKHSRLAQRAGFEGEALELSHEVEGAIDAALAEARHAVATMREDGQPGSLADALQRHVDDFSDRFALRAELAIEGPAPELDPRSRAEVLRIVQEALTNARRHADATVVRVTVTSGMDLRITVVDNGRGFRPESTTPGFGLESMRQRAALVGGTLDVSSTPQDGTRVELVIPIRAVATPNPQREDDDGR
jgi:signal transduction histidine kinase